MKVEEVIEKQKQEAKAIKNSEIIKKKNHFNWLGFVFSSVFVVSSSFGLFMLYKFRHRFATK